METDDGANLEHGDGDGDGDGDAETFNDGDERRREMATGSDG